MSTPLMIFLSVLPGVRIGALVEVLKVSCSFVVKVCIDKVIAPLSLGLENFTSKCCVNLFWISSTIGLLPEIKASST